MNLLLHQARRGRPADLGDIDERAGLETGAAGLDPVRLVVPFGPDLNHSGKPGLFRADLPDAEFLCAAEVLVDMNPVGTGECDFHGKSFLSSATYDVESTGTYHVPNSKFVRGEA
jgi:hypothetical protein